MMKMLLVVSILFSCAVPTITASQLQYGDDLTCSSPVYISVQEASCGNDNNNNGICNFGDDLHTSGLVVFDEDLSSENLCIVTKACLNGYSWMCKTFRNTVNNICQEMNLQGVNGEECPSAGTYTYDAEVTLPGQSGFNLGNGTVFFFSRFFNHGCIFFLFFSNKGVFFLFPVSLCITLIVLYTFTFQTNERHVDLYKIK
jgi:hypothetical protein